MKVNLEYLKKMLTAFQGSDKAYTNILLLKKQELDCDSEEFVFHLQILVDKGLVETESGSQDIGLSRLGNGSIQWSVRNLRLTSSGHDFIYSLTNETIWNKIKKDFKDQSISVLVEATKSLVSDFVTKQLSSGG